MAVPRNHDQPLLNSNEPTKALIGMLAGILLILFLWWAFSTYAHANPAELAGFLFGGCADASDMWRGARDQYPD